MGACVLLLAHVVVVLMALVDMVVVVRGRRAVVRRPMHPRRERRPAAVPQHDDADADHEQRGDEVHPRIQVLGDDELGEGERHETEREDADRVGDGHNAAERERIARTSSRADEVGRDDRLAVSRRQRVRRSPEEREGERDEDEADAQVIARDEGGEASRAAARTNGCRRRPSRAGGAPASVPPRTSADPDRTSSGLFSRSFG